MALPRIVLFDEPSLGLAPTIVDDMFEIISKVRDDGAAVLLVEQLIEKALALADRVYALARGSIVMEAGAKEPNLPDRLEQAYFGQGVHAPLSD